MVPPELLVFWAVAAVLVVTPGPDMALVARNALVAGRGAVPLTVLGICAGIAVHALAAAIGLSALLQASATAYALVKAAGGAYLVFLGIRPGAPRSATTRRATGCSARRAGSRAPAPSGRGS